MMQCVPPLSKTAPLLAILRAKMTAYLQLTALMNRAVQSDGVVDLFDLLKKTADINLLSDEFWKQ